MDITACRQEEYVPGTIILIIRTHKVSKEHVYPRVYKSILGPDYYVTGTVQKKSVLQYK